MFSCQKTILILLTFSISLRYSIGAKRPRKVDSSTEDEIDIQNRVEKFNNMTFSWNMKSREGISIFKEVEEAFDTLSIAINKMENIQTSVSTNPKPIELGSLILLYAELPVHYYTGYRLLNNVLEVMEVSPGTKKAIQLKELCEHGGFQSTMRRNTCHDIYALRCTHIYLSGKKRIYEQCLNEFNSLHASQMPPSISWSDSSLITRQIPGLSHLPWWNAHEVPWQDMLFKPIWKHFNKIRQEIIQSMLLLGNDDDMLDSVDIDVEGNIENKIKNNLNDNIWNSLGSVQDYGTNSQWDSSKAYDKVRLYEKDKWNKKACMKFKILCSVLRDKMNLKLTNGFQEFMSQRNEEIWDKSIWNSGYRTYPPLGISLHRVWPNSRIKPHLGPAARLVSSIPIIAPLHSTISVGDLTRKWNETLTFKKHDKRRKNQKIINNTLSPPDPDCLYEKVGENDDYDNVLNQCYSTQEEDEVENEELYPFFVYDDSFLFSVNNDVVRHTNEESNLKSDDYLVFLSFYTWHPDLLRNPKEKPDKQANIKHGEKMKFMESEG